MKDKNKVLDKKTLEKYRKEIKDDFNNNLKDDLVQKLANDVSKEVILGNPQEGSDYYFTNTGAPMRYWLGSSYVDTYSNNAYFGLCHVNDHEVYSRAGSQVYNSNGGIYAHCYGVRPVVSLQSDINLEYNSTKEEWEFSK